MIGRQNSFFSLPVAWQKPLNIYDFILNLILFLFIDIVHYLFIDYTIVKINFRVLFNKSYKRNNKIFKSNIKARLYNNHYNITKEIVVLNQVISQT